MHCYCFKQVKKGNANFLEISFTDIDPTDDTKYCTEWFTVFVI